MSGETCNGDCDICKSDFGTCPLTRSGDVFKKDDDTRDVGDADSPRIRAGACPVCHSDLHAYHRNPQTHPESEWYCVLCGYEEDEDGGALL